MVNGKEQWSIRFRKASARTLKTFLLWLYTEELVPPPPAHAEADGLPKSLNNVRLVGGDDTGDSELDWDDLDLLDLYIFARHYSVINLVNQTVFALLSAGRRNRRTASAAMIHKAYTMLPRSDYLRSSLPLDAWTRLTENRRQLPECTSQFPVDYISDILRLFLGERMHCGPEGYAPQSLCTHQNCRSPYPDGAVQRGLCMSITDQRRITEAKAPEFELYKCFDSTATVFIDPDARPFVVFKDIFCRKSSFFKGAFEGPFAEAGVSKIRLDNESPGTFRIFLTWLYTGVIEIPPLDADADVEDEVFAERLSSSQLNKSSQQSAQSVNQFARPSSSCNRFDRPQEERDCETESFFAVPGGSDNTASDTDNEFGDAQEWVQYNLIQLYIFADRRGVRELRNAAITRLISDSENHVLGWHLTSTYYDDVRFAFDNLPKHSLLRQYLIDEAAWFWGPEQYADKDMHTLP